MKTEINKKEIAVSTYSNALFGFMANSFEAVLD